MTMAARRRLGLIAASLVVCVCAIATATTLTEAALKCPVCGNVFHGLLISSTNTFGGQDRDFFSRAVGYQPVLCYPKTCKRCLFSGYPDDFAEGNTLSQGIVELFKEGKIKPSKATPGIVKERFPPGQKYDIIAQWYQKEGRPAGDIAQQYLAASYVIRVSFELGEYLPKDFPELIWEGIQKGDDKKQEDDSNPAVAAVILADKLAGTEAPKEQLMAALGLYRSYGENTQALCVFQQLKASLDKKVVAAIEKPLVESIELERYYQRKALPFLKKMADSAEKKDKAVGYYLCGEILRRLESWEAAVKYFNKAEAQKTIPDWLKTWTAEQKGRLEQTIQAIKTLAAP